MDEKKGKFLEDIAYFFARKTRQVLRPFKAFSGTVSSLHFTLFISVENLYLIFEIRVKCSYCELFYIPPL